MKGEIDREERSIAQEARELGAFSVSYLRQTVLASRGQFSLRPNEHVVNRKTDRQLSAFDRLPSSCQSQALT